MYSSGIIFLAWLSLPDRLCGKAKLSLTAQTSTLYLGAGNINTGENIQASTEAGDTTCGMPQGLLVSVPQEMAGKLTSKH